MTPFNLLTMAGAPEAGQMDMTPLIVGALGLVLLIAFCIGFAKGVRKVSWGGLVWIGACLLFGFVCREYGEGLINSINITMTDAQGVVYDLSALIFFVIAVVCVFAVLAVYGIFSLIFRGKLHRKAKKVSSKPAQKDAYGFEYEDEEEDLDWEDEAYEETVAKETANPSILSRFLGGIFCILNVVTVVAAVLLIAVLLIDSTALKESLAMLYEIPVGTEGEMLMPMLAMIAKRHGIDLLMIGIMIGMAGKGRKKGLMEALRTLFMKVGNIVVVVLCLYLPFSPFAVPVQSEPMPTVQMIPALNALVEYFVQMTVTAMGPELQMISPILGQIVAGVAMAIVASIVMMIVNFVWRKLNFTLRKVGFLRGLDGSASCLVYLLIGAVVCVLVWAGIVALSVFNVLDATALFSENAPISGALYRLCEVIVKPFLEGLMMVQ